jgi:hypothetical protein
MNSNPSNWFENPTKMQVTWATFLWAISVFLLFMVMTDGFAHLPFQGKHVPIGFLVLTSTFAVIRLQRNYRKRSE